MIAYPPQAGAPCDERFYDEAAFFGSGSAVNAFGQLWPLAELCPLCPQVYVTQATTYSSQPKGASSPMKYKPRRTRYYPTTLVQEETRGCGPAYYTGAPNRHANQIGTTGRRSAEAVRNAERGSVAAKPSSSAVNRLKGWKG